MAQIDQFLAAQAQNRASDFHLSPGNPPLFRIVGELHPVATSALTPNQTKALIDEIMTPDQRKTFAETRDIDFAYEPGTFEGRFRVNVFVGRLGVSATFRLIELPPRSIEDLGLPPIITQLAQLKKGLIVVTGATGSGKSTTLAAMIHHINSTRHDHILTVEDPIEFVHSSIKCLINQREVGVHTKSFASALRAALRENPDVILVGEMRDLETIELAVTAAETGHLVLGTLHTSSAAKSVDRMISVFPEGQQNQIRSMLSESLKAVLAQNLLRTIENKRVAAFEVLIGNNAVGNLIRESQSHQIPSVIQTSHAEGMMLMSESIQRLVDTGVVAAEEASKFDGLTSRQRAMHRVTTKLPTT